MPDDGHPIDFRPTARGIASLALLLALAGLPLLACGGPAGSSDRPPLVVQGGTLIDGTGAEPVQNGVVVASRGTIRAAGPVSDVEAPPEARVVDADGQYIVPGYIDAHVHYSQTGWFTGRPDAMDLRDRYPYAEVIAGLQSNPGRFFGSYLCSGVTGTFDVGGYPWTRDLEARGERDPDAPRVETAGPLLSTVDFWLNLPDQRQFIHMANDSIVRRTVRSHARLGSSAIKVWFITPPQPPDSARASRLVSAADEEAEKFDLPLIVHATGLWEAKEAVRSGAEVLVHSVFSDTVDQEFIDLAAENDVAYITTITVQEGYRNAGGGKALSEYPYPTACVDSTTRARIAEGVPEEMQPDGEVGSGVTPSMEVAIENARRLHEAGVTVAMGTDAGNPGTLHGPSVYREMELLSMAGMSPSEVLTASTRGAAEAMGRADDLGTLEPGKLADLVVLSENPLDSVANFSSVSRVVKGGWVVRAGDDSGSGG